MESASAWATKEEKATNTVKFTKEADNKVKVSVNGVEAEEEVPVVAGDKLTLSLVENKANDGEFSVKLGEKVIGKFTNIGANYAEYLSSEQNKQYPLTISAEAANTVVLLYDINGQQFNNLTSDGKIKDNAAPVFVVNEEVDGFLLGTAFALDYTVVDVLKSKTTNNTLEYYQYNPNKAEVKYNTLSTSTYFMDTVCYVNGNKEFVMDPNGATQTTVFKEKGKEFVSVTMTTSDGANQETYDLAWYANKGATEKIGKIDYLTLDKNTDGATYTFLNAKETAEGGENELVVDKEKYDDSIEAFQELLKKAAKDVYAGSNSYIYFPSFKWMINDNNGYRNLRFTISYKTPSSNSASTSSSLSYNNLKLAVSSEGMYEFKIFATDKAGNTMKYYLDGELVSVTSSNVWDIEEIPSFTFQIADKGLKIEEEKTATSRKASEILDKTYTLSDFKVVGASNLKEDYKLYKVDLSKYNKDLEVSKQLTTAHLYAVTYEDLQKIDLTKASDSDGYFKLYLRAYAEALAKQLGTIKTTDIERIESCFGEVQEYDSRITEENASSEWEAYNKFEWSASSQSFKTVEEGSYLILADYWDSELATSQRAAAYKLVVVESKADVIAGENNWLENNMVSVILFSVAGVMLILIIILLLIKPSNETLEDVDAAAAKMKEKKKKDK